ncbi:helix-turn-helix domain-containing protein [Alkalihalobacillus pseudalcaliphilus]|uniref:helix-turn-helix domain-containing protein n=1 Tax=Alkalihalobacillus pseudalcaliphilus TaxID=79884 RepID=UPI00235ED95A|nr:helix-turn-helix domain-containing protein [Alkalihalobacillus pseudalcaliphilus]
MSGSRKILSERLKEMRVNSGLTQSKLAEGICTQALISNMEKEENKENPSSHTLFLLSERLGVSMSYLYGQDEVNKVNNDVLSNFRHIKYMVEKLKAKRDYYALKYIIDNELKKEGSLTNTDKQFLYWHQAIYIYYLDHDFTQAKEMLDKALELNVVNKEQQIEIKMSYGIILSDEKKHEESEKILLECLNEYSTKELHIPTIYSKIVFNLSANLTKRREYKESLNYSLLGIENCMNHSSLFMLGDLYYQTGYNYYRLNEKEIGRDYMKRSILIFELQGNIDMVRYINNNIEKINIF